MTLIDLDGDSNYLKTAIHAETGSTAPTKEHLGLAATLNIPVFVIITKWDLVEKERLERVIASTSTLLSRAGMSAGSKRLKWERDAVKAAGGDRFTIGTVNHVCILRH
ncbi:unnamed protein product [Cylicocyclus nassatus]|uniref:Tr-type G domain-containing protein n=1 Tax=Cylicocyclus nassatus TaxID=53992 RepID=A0AA36MAC2_CYLNA|nr:unnamed protein product [Cylicocyclus nassatus]